MKISVGVILVFYWIFQLFLILINLSFQNYENPIL